MNFLRSGSRALVGLLAFAIVGFAGTASASAAITPTVVADDVTIAAVSDGTIGAVTGSAFEAAPPGGNYAATADANPSLAVFPLAGGTYGMLSTGDAAEAGAPNSADNSSEINGGGGNGHGGAVNDIVTLRIEFEVPANRNCLTVDTRFLTEEFPEFIGEQYNDAFIAELDANDFQVAGDGSVTAPSNFAFDPDGRLVTVNAAGTSADNALGTTYDGATPVLRATTPITPGPHKLYLTVYDANDSSYDSTAFIDNIRLRNAAASNCTRGSLPNENADNTCMNKKPTIFASSGVAKGTKGDDIIQGSDAADKIKGGGGDDIICGGGGADQIDGQGGNDRIVGNSGKDMLMGSSGNDRLDGGKGDDTVRGQGDNDFVKGAGGNDQLFGGPGNDKLVGNRGNDLLAGRGDQDKLRGGKGKDELRGGPGKDRCTGGKGKDKVSSC